MVWQWIRKVSMAVNQRLWSGLADGLRIYSSEVEDETHFVTTGIISYRFWICYYMSSTSVQYS